MPEQPSGPEREQLISFEEFRGSGVVPHYNNFFLHFGAGTDPRYSAAANYRQRPYYQRLTQEHPELATSLCTKVQDLRARRLSLECVEAEMYEAYKIMRSYGISDQELFA